MNIPKYKSQYDSLPKEIFCLSLNRKIKVTRSGFKHVFHGKLRKRKDIEMRGLCISKLVPLIENLNLYQEHTKKIQSNGDIEFWSLQGVINKIGLHITIRKIGKQECHIYSWHYKGNSPKINEATPRRKRTGYQAKGNAPRGGELTRSD